MTDYNDLTPEELEEIEEVNLMWVEMWLKTGTYDDAAVPKDGIEPQKLD